MTYELIPQPDAGLVEIRVDGACIAKIDWMLFQALQMVQPTYVEAPWLEAVSRPGKDV